ncbi:MAG TPA: hypothetical protein GXX31_04125 [Methanothermobacter sp.]|nr:hypothetical protein [Methanothermobacter sp.]
MIKETIQEFKEKCLVSYKRLLRSLDEKYCWRCPQRVTRDKIGCREADAWIRMKKALDDSIRSYIREEMGDEYLDKIIQRIHERNLEPKILIIKGPKVNEFLIVKEKSSGFKRGEKVIIDDKILKVEDVEKGYIRTTRGSYPPYRIHGTLLDTINKEHPIYEYIKGIIR